MNTIPSVDKAAVELVAYGDDLPNTDERLKRDVRAILRELESLLSRAGRSWAEVSLLMLANSVFHEDPLSQHRVDATILEELGKFGDEHSWRPPLVGATTLSTFFSSYGSQNPEIRSGVLFVAFCSNVMKELPVAHAMRDHDLENVARQAVEKAARASARVRTRLGLPSAEDLVYQDSVALLLSTGSAHGDWSMKDDFRACYGAGVRLVELADDQPLRLLGGHASNNRPGSDPRRPPQRQMLYYSSGDATGRRYESTDHFGAVCAFIPTGAPAFELSHPYDAGEDAGPLNVAWAAGDDDRGSTRFLVESIDGETVAEFLERHWGLGLERLLEMADDETPIPARPELHEITLLSAPSLAKISRSWPNVPIWMERRTRAGVETPLMRLVRGEESDSFVYLVRLNRKKLESAAGPVNDRMRTFGAGASSLSFLCESRRYVLESFGSNEEAWSTLRSTREDATAIGIYLNGEHAVGFKTAIGYHNYSMVNVCFRPHPEQPERAV